MTNLKPLFPPAIERRIYERQAATDKSTTIMVDLDWGAPSLYHQLPMLTRDQCAQFERWRDSVFSLQIAGLMSEKEQTRILKRLASKINVARIAAGKEKEIA